MTGFLPWLADQTGRRDLIGDIARDIARDHCRPRPNTDEPAGPTPQDPRRPK